MAEFKAAKVPPDMVPVFQKAEELISNFFTKVIYHPDKGRIEIDSDRYMWVRASSLATSFRVILEEVYGERGADQILYKFGKAVGQQEAKEFHKKFNIQTPLEKLERLEQLRAIENGYTILVGKVEHTCEGIDTPEQYATFVERQKTDRI